ncbi:proteasome core particle subunit beta 3 [Lignoscripta atroalba]|nr:proteasome core particle subunit beta 3 [Lignoscripta atroalba]
MDLESLPVHWSFGEVSPKQKASPCRRPRPANWICDSQFTSSLHNKGQSTTSRLLFRKLHILKWVVPTRRPALKLSAIYLEQHIAPETLYKFLNPTTPTQEARQKPSKHGTFPSHTLPKLHSLTARFQSSPFSINGGACVAMVGKDCVAIACDLRLGLQSLTVSNNFPKIFSYGDVYLGLTGLATDVSTVSDLFRYKVNMYRLREERQISPQTMANLVSSSLYEKRFGPYFISPVVAGINHTTGKPFICGFDSIGCIDFAKDFIVSGTASDQLFGTCEGLWEPDLEPEDLFETISQALLNAVDRDALSGWGAHVYIIEKDKVTKRLLKGRQD